MGQAKVKKSVKAESSNELGKYAANLSDLRKSHGQLMGHQRNMLGTMQQMKVEEDRLRRCLIEAKMEIEILAPGYFYNEATMELEKKQEQKP